MVRQYYQKGEIIHVDLGTPPYEVIGHEQGLTRPCLVVKSFPNLGLAIVAPCTTKQPKQFFYTIVHLKKGSGGLYTETYVLCHQIRTISIDRVKKRIGKLEKADYLRVQSVLADMLEV